MISMLSTNLPNNLHRFSSHYISLCSTCPCRADKGQNRSSMFLQFLCSIHIRLQQDKYNPHITFYHKILVFLYTLGNSRTMFINIIVYTSLLHLQYSRVA